MAPNSMDDLAFQESWKQEAVELAAAGAVVAGAASFATKGNFDDVIRYTKKSAKQASEGLNRYVNRNGSPKLRFLNNVGRKTRKNLANYDNSERYELSEIQKLMGKARENVDEEQVMSEAFDRYKNMEGRAFAKARQKNGDLKPTDFNYKKNFDEVAEEVRTEQTKKQMSRMAENPDAIRHLTGNGKPDNKRRGGKFLPKDWRENFAGSAVAGAGFGAGITALHSADDVIRRSENNKRDRENSFQNAGSFIKKSNEGEIDMEKLADMKGRLIAAKDAAQNGTQQFAEKIPKPLREIGHETKKGVGTAIGFTGVSLGTANLMNKVEDDGKSRVIIEMGDDDAQSRNPEDHAFGAGQYSGMPRAANETSEGIPKLGLLNKQ